MCYDNIMRPYYVDPFSLKNKNRIKLKKLPKKC